jgi:DNA-binding CsgD family transcriptional regulator
MGVERIRRPGRPLECLTHLSGGAAVTAKRPACSARQRPSGSTGDVRLKIHDADVAAVRDAMDEADFDRAWAEVRRSPSTSRSPTLREAAANGTVGQRQGIAHPGEHKTVRFVSEELADKDIATRLLVSQRTVQTHLTDVYQTRSDLPRTTRSRNSPG